MSAINLQASLDNLGTHSKKLNRITDEANETVRLVEQYLDDCSLGAVVSVDCETLYEWDENGYVRNTYLEHRRYPENGKFRLVVTTKDGDDKVVDARPWSDSGRKTKHDTLLYLPHLLAEMVAVAREMIDEGESRTKSIIETVQGIIRPRPKK
jgi:hypothetical protein